MVSDFKKFYSMNGTMALAYPFDRLSRKLALRKEVAGKNINATPIVVFKTTPNMWDRAPKRQFFALRKNYRSTAVTPDELVARTRFATVSRNVANRMQDISKITTDQQNFMAQINEPGGYQSMKSYIWSLELAAYDQAHPQG